MKKRRIGIFGGAFDPVHTGHTAIAGSFLQSRLIHALWILPTPDPPHKMDQQVTAFDHRLQMLLLAFEGAENIEVLDLESRLPTPSYTLQTLNFLQNRYPDTLFYLCIGEDSLMDFSSWYQYTRILEKVTLLVAERKGYGNRSEIPEKILEKAVFADHRPINISSTGIRRSGEDPKKISDHLPEAVYDYIVQNNLYGNHS